MTHGARWLRGETGLASVAVLVAISALSLSGPRVGPAPATAVVTRQDFSDVIVEPGVISSQNLRLYSSSLNGLPAKLTYLAPDGATVNAGDVLARFDVTSFVQVRDRAALELREAESDVVRARAEAQLEALRAATDLDAAAELRENASRALANQTSGKGAVELAAADVAIGDAARELQQARTTYTDMKPLLAEGFVTRAELDRAEQALRHAEDQHRLATTRRDALVNFEGPAGISRATSDLKTATANAARQTETAAARGRERQATLDIALSRVDQLRANIAALTDQIAHGTIVTEVAGLVVHRELYLGADKRKPQIGDDLAAGQPFIGVPDLSRLSVEMRVRETDLHRLSNSSRVGVRVDAYPGLELPAALGFIGAIAEADPARAGAKFFPVTIVLETRDSRLRSGMTARVDIDVTSLASALTVPVQAVFSDSGRRYVLVTRGGRTERRDVTVTAENDVLAVLTAGVIEGDVVLLVDPNRGLR